MFAWDGSVHRLSILVIRAHAPVISLIAVELAVVRLKRALGRRSPPLGSLPPDGLFKGLTWAGDNHDQGLQLAKHHVDGTVGAADEPATWPARAGSDSGALGE